MEQRFASMGLSPEEIQRELPHLKLSQIFDSLAFYLDHREVIDLEIEQDREEIVLKEFPAGKYTSVISAMEIYHGAQN